MKRQLVLSTSLLGIAALLGSSASAFAENRLSFGSTDGEPSLGSAARFAVLSAATGGNGAVTCTDASLKGSIGSSGARPAVVLTRCALRGMVTAPVTPRVLADFNNAYLALEANTCDQILTGTLAGISLAPGVYCFDDAASLTGTLTLNGPSSGIWIFLVNGDLTGNSFNTVMAGSARPCNVYWSPSGAATMTTSNLKGNVLAGQAVTITGGSFIGRAFATKAVTLTTVAAEGCGWFD